jgi:hypothetical protein
MLHCSMGQRLLWRMVPEYSLAEQSDGPGELTDSNSVIETLEMSLWILPQTPYFSMT